MRLSKIYAHKLLNAAVGPKREPSASALGGSYEADVKGGVRLARFGAQEMFDGLGMGVVGPWI